jgi:thiosulfate/3-mercaptopyruvate sulfurtransferase
MPSLRFIYPPSAAYRCVLLGTLSLALGCGTNQYEHELQIEESAIKLAHETRTGGYDLVSTQELKQLLDSKQVLLLMDAMPAVSSYELAHLPGAVNFEFPKEVLDAWDDQMMSGQTLASYEQFLGPEKDRLIVVYCGFVKCARSHNAAVFAKQLGYTNVKRYPGGIYAWRGAGFPVESP